MSPLFESGIVDVATTSLSEIKQRTTTIYGRQNSLSGSGGGSAPLSFVMPAPADVFEFRDRFDNDTQRFTYLPNYDANRDTIFAMSPRELSITGTAFRTPVT